MSKAGSILADIGGTNARFALLDESGEITRLHVYLVRENPTLLGALESFRDQHCEGYRIRALALAVAGPVLGDTVALTNSDWVCSKSQIQESFGTKDVFILNDFEALAIAIIKLKPEEIQPIQADTANPSRPMLVMGPGTGLGIAALKPTAGGYEPLTTEAGHIRYAPANDRERNLVRILSRALGFVSAEDLVSGPGLVNLYNANCQLVSEEPKPYSPADIVAQARQGDNLCRLVLDDFAAIFGSVASQMALSFIALGGVYLTGGVLEKMGADFNQTRFLERFATNPRMAHLLNKIPVYRVLTEIPAFSGLKVVIENCLNSNSQSKNAALG